MSGNLAKKIIEAIKEDMRTYPDTITVNYVIESISCGESYAEIMASSNLAQLLSEVIDQYHGASLPPDIVEQALSEVRLYFCGSPTVPCMQSGLPPRESQVIEKRTGLSARKCERLAIDLQNQIIEALSNWIAKNPKPNEEIVRELLKLKTLRDFAIRTQDDPIYDVIFKIYWNFQTKHGQLLLIEDAIADSLFLFSIRNKTFRKVALAVTR